jgi:BirA family transcriptional regulator, biotin operon repressor / biotin---[acetyl-CoA-carboxylase] ligase
MRGPRPVLLQYAQVDSTLDEAARLLKSRAAPFALVATSQTSGRGRRGRNWASPEGNLYFTAALDADGIAAGQLPLFTLYAALRLTHRLNKIKGVSGAWLKWPNDIWVGRKKLVGMLAELVAAKGRKALVLGIGVNLNTQKFPAELERRATSLKKIARRNFDVAQVGVLVADEVFAAWESFHSGAYEKDLYKLWARYDNLTGRMIKFDRAGEVARGRVMGIAADGALCVKVGRKIEALRSGEVSLSRYL